MRPKLASSQAGAPGRAGRDFFREGWLFCLLALAGGVALRSWFIHTSPPVQGDSLLYGDIAKNWLIHGVYGRTVQGASGPSVVPTLIRLPGYPAFLALCFFVFGVDRYRAVLYVQGALDLVTCVLIAGFVRRALGSRAALIAFLLAALCPFTANYAAAPLTETLSIFCVALSFYSLAEYLARPHPALLGLLAFSWSYAALLRPDGALLAVVLFFAFILEGRKLLGRARSVRLALACALLSLLPFVPWTVRNLRTFHVFQPLVSRYATEPDESSTPGFRRWMKTWAADFVSTDEIYWNANSAAMHIGQLSARAFDTPAEYVRTKRLFADYNAITTLTPAIDARFASLAADRVRRHPVRFYIELPALRVADMWLRPRVELLKIPLRWWQYAKHPGATCFALLFGALNLAYLAAALAGAFRWPRRRPSLLGAMLGFILLRSLLLATIEAPEPRYTLECCPVIIAAAACALSSRGKREA